MLEKDTSHQMQMRFSVSEQERHKVMEELERTQLVNKDLVQSLSLFEVSFKSYLVGSAGGGKMLQTRFADIEWECQNSRKQQRCWGGRSSLTGILFRA